MEHIIGRNFSIC